MNTRVLNAYNEHSKKPLGSGIAVVDSITEPIKVLKILMEGLTPAQGTGFWVIRFRGLPIARSYSPFDLIYLDEEFRVLHAVEITESSEFVPFKGVPASALVLPPSSISQSKTFNGDHINLRPDEKSSSSLSAQLASLAARGMTISAAGGPAPVQPKVSITTAPAPQTPARSEPDPEGVLKPAKKEPSQPEVPSATSGPAAGLQSGKKRKGTAAGDEALLQPGKTPRAVQPDVGMPPQQDVAAQRSVAPPETAAKKDVEPKATAAEAHASPVAAAPQPLAEPAVAPPQAAPPVEPAAQAASTIASADFVAEPDQTSIEDAPAKAEQAAPDLPAAPIEVPPATEQAGAEPAAGPESQTPTVVMHGAKLTQEELFRLLGADRAFGTVELAPEWPPAPARATSDEPPARTEVHPARAPEPDRPLRDNAVLAPAGERPEEAQIKKLARRSEIEKNEMRMGRRWDVKLLYALFPELHPAYRPEFQVPYVDFMKYINNPEEQERISTKIQVLSWLYPELELETVEKRQREHRRAPRIVDPGLVGYYYSSVSAVPHQVKYFSVWGFYMVTDEKWMPGTIIRVTLQVVGTEGTNPGEALTVHARVVNWDKQGAGFEFVLPGFVDE